MPFQGQEASKKEGHNFDKCWCLWKAVDFIVSGLYFGQFKVATRVICLSEYTQESHMRKKTDVSAIVGSYNRMAGVRLLAPTVARRRQR